MAKTIASASARQYVRVARAVGYFTSLGGIKEPVQLRLAFRLTDSRAMKSPAALAAGNLRRSSNCCASGLRAGSSMAPLLLATTVVGK